MLRLVVLSTLILASPAFAQPTAKKLNVLFILSDDQRADTIAALGNKHVKTPNLDALVKRGTVFQRAYCMGSTGAAVCVPSRAMIMTGRTLFRVNVQIGNQPTWPEAFVRAGYAAFAVGKWHNSEESLLRAFPQVSGVFLGGMTSPYGVPLVRRDDDGKLVSEKDAKHIGERITENAIAFLKKQKAGTPFLGYVAYNIPHDPRTAPKKYHDLYAQSPPPPPANFLPMHPFDNGEMVVRDEKLAPWPRTPEIVSKELADYYACITFLDDEVGRLIAALKEAGLYEDTIIVFTSDHGLAIGSHGLFGKQNLYEHSMRVPMIMAGPGIPHGSTNTFAYLLDVFSTLGDMTGVKGPKTSEGISLLPAMRNETMGRDTLMTAYRHLQRSVRDDRWHLIVYPQINRKQLFDLQNDPDEIKDLSADAARAGDVERLMAALKGWQEKLGDKAPLSVAKPASEKFEIPKEKKKGKASASRERQRPVETTSHSPNRVVSAFTRPNGTLAQPVADVRRGALILPFAFGRRWRI